MAPPKESTGEHETKRSIFGRGYAVCPLSIMSVSQVRVGNLTYYLRIPFIQGAWGNTRNKCLEA